MSSDAECMTLTVCSDASAGVSSAIASNASGSTIMVPAAPQI